MTWWQWTLAGIVAYGLVIVWVLALCRASGKTDEKEGCK